MSTPLEAVRAALLADPTVTGLLAQRIYPLVAAQGSALPMLVLTVVSEVPQNSLTGMVETRALECRLQVDAYADSYLGAHQVANAAAAVIGNLTAPTLSAQRDSAQDLYDDESSLYRVMTEFVVWVSP